MSSNKNIQDLMAWIAERMKHTIGKIILRKYHESKRYDIHWTKNKQVFCLCQLCVWCTVKTRTLWICVETARKIQQSNDWRNKYCTCAVRAHEMYHGLVALKEVQFDEMLDKEINDILDEIAMSETPLTTWTLAQGHLFTVQLPTAHAGRKRVTKKNKKKNVVIAFNTKTNI